MITMLNPNASAFAYAFSRVPNPLFEASERLEKCNIPMKDKKQLHPVLSEWFSSSTLNSTLRQWEDHNQQKESRINTHSDPMTFVLYNVQGLNSRGLEVIELINKVEASFIICTEVGEAWRKCSIPDFNMFYEKGTNKNGGVIIGVGKHLKATKLETKLSNTLVLDIFGLNEPLRVIGIYWPDSQKRDINEISQFIIGNTIIAGDFNATVKQWNSSTTDKRVE